MNTATKLVGIGLGVGIVVLVVLVILLIRAVWCRRSPDHWHLWQNTAMADRLNRHVYLCFYCKATRKWFEPPPSRRPVAPKPSNDM